MAQLDQPILPPLLYRYRPLSNDTIDREIAAIDEQYIWLSNYRELNDPMEGFYEPSGRLQKENNYTEAARQLLSAKKQIGICSFSDTHENELMWTHYATNYAGICVAYRPIPLIKGLPDDTHLARLTYGNTPPKIDNSEATNLDKAATKILSHKKSNWVYEREWRVLGPRGRLNIESKGCARAVYLGSRIAPSHKDRIMMELAQVHVSIHEMRVSDYGHIWTKIKNLK